MNDEIPSTEQGLNDFVRYATAEIKRSEIRIKKLNEMVTDCNAKLLLIKGDTDAVNKSK